MGGGMRQGLVLAGAVTLALAGCGGSSAPSGAQVDHSSSLASDITAKAPTQIQQNNPGTTATLTNVTCVRSGSTQTYSCLGDLTLVSVPPTPAELASPPTPTKQAFSGTCDNAGNCTWQSQ
jgi:hypothetical protein